MQRAPVSWSGRLGSLCVWTLRGQGQGELPHVTQDVVRVKEVEQGRIDGARVVGVGWAWASTPVRSC
jgi:hypothetical protein